MGSTAGMGHLLVQVALVVVAHALEDGGGAAGNQLGGMLGGGELVGRGVGADEGEDLEGIVVHLVVDDEDVTVPGGHLVVDLRVVGGFQGDEVLLGDGLLGLAAAQLFDAVHGDPDGDVEVEDAVGGVGGAGLEGLLVDGVVGIGHAAALVLEGGEDGIAEDGALGEGDAAATALGAGAREEHGLVVVVLTDGEHVDLHGEGVGVDAGGGGAEEGEDVVGGGVRLGDAVEGEELGEGGALLEVDGGLLRALGGLIIEVGEEGLEDDFILVLGLDAEGGEVLGEGGAEGAFAAAGDALDDDVLTEELEEAGDEGIAALEGAAADELHGGRKGWIGEGISFLKGTKKRGDERGRKLDDGEGGRAGRTGCGTAHEEGGEGEEGEEEATAKNPETHGIPALQEEEGGEEGEGEGEEEGANEEGPEGGHGRGGRRR